MAAPVIASASSNKTGNPLTDITFTYITDGPSGLTVGDLQLAQIGVNGAATDPTIPTPTDWTLVARTLGNDGSNHVGQAIFWRLYNGQASDVFTATPDSSTVGMTAKMVRITGHDAANPINNVAITPVGSAADPYTIFGVSTLRDECLVFFFYCAASAAGVTSSFSVGTEQWDFGIDPGNASSLSASSFVKTTAGSTGDETVDLSAAPNRACGFCVAIQPPASGGRRSGLLLRGVS